MKTPEDEAFEEIERIQRIRTSWVSVEKPQRTWVGLTDEEIDVIYEQHHNQYDECISVSWGYERAIEAKLKEKNYE